MKMQSLLLLIYMLLSTSALLGQGLPFRNFSIQNGLSQSVVNDIFQDRDGYVWIGTEYGLNRFNRFRFDVFLDENGLPDNNILSIYQKRNGDLIVGTERGISLLEGNRFVRLPGTEMLANIPVINLFEDSAGGLWAGTDGAGLYYFRDDSFRIISINEGLPDNIIRKVIELPNRQMVVSTRGGVAFIDHGRVIRSLTQKDGLNESRTRDVYYDGSGSIWIATRNGVNIFKDESVISLGVDDGLIHPRVTAIIGDGSNGVWISTEGGISHFRNGSFINYSDMNGLSNNIVNTMMRDFENNVWFGTYGGGVDLLTGEKFMHYTVQQGLQSNMITSFAQLHDGSMLIGTYGGGIGRVTGNSVTRYLTADGLIDNRVYTIFKNGDHDFLIGTRNGITRYRNGMFSKDALTAVLPDPKVRSFLKDDSGTLWIGTYGGGIVRVRNGQVLDYLNTSNVLPDNIVMRIVQSQDGSVWVATYGGIVVFRDDMVSTISTDEGLTQNSILTLFEDSAGNIWAGTFGGLNRITGEEITTYTVQNGLPNNVIYFIQEDLNGMLWLGTNNGLVRFNTSLHEDLADPERIRDKIRFKRYTTESGLISDEMNANAVFKDSNGDLWMGSVGGAVHFRWRMDREVDQGPPVHIERIRLFDGDIDADSRYVFKHSQNFIGFEFVGLSYSNPSEILYEYRLRGIDQGWQQTRDRIIRYTTLPDGEFRFEVRARNNDGFWSEQVARITFRIAPPFWKTWWFFLLVLILLFITSAFIYRYYKISRLVDLERIRIRIASDLHDDVGSSLTEIALQADFLKATQYDPKIGESLQQIGDMSRKIVTTMDDIVWSIDARNDTFGDLIDRMQDYASNVLIPANIEPRFTFKGFDSEKVMKLEVRQNLYLLFKEAVNNAAKHSGATKMDIYFERYDDRYKLRISDNGTGIPDKIRSGGHGLKNMKLRAQRIGASIDIQNKNGLTITISGKGI